MDIHSQCQFCSGTGKCAKCYGSGIEAGDPYSLECGQCRGKGTCVECLGRGKPPGLLREVWEWFWSLDYYQQRFAMAGVVAVVLGFLYFWQFMIPFAVLIAAVSLYLYRSRTKRQSVNCPGRK
jgi:hypothetical protein